MADFLFFLSLQNAASRNVFYTLSGSMTLLNIVWLKILMATRTGKFFVRHTQITSKPESENEEAAPESPELEATLSSQKVKLCLFCFHCLLVVLTVLFTFCLIQDSFLVL